MADDNDPTAKRETSPWHWPRVERSDRAVVVTQRGEEWCGPACGEMLLADRGVVVDQEEIAAELPVPAEASELAARLGDVSPLRWRGGALREDGVTWKLLRALTDRYGSWAALLEPRGFRQVGHWVVVDGISDDGVVWVRDPAGSAYGIPLTDFAELWRYTVLVLQAPRS